MAKDTDWIGETLAVYRGQLAQRDREIEEGYAVRCRLAEEVGRLRAELDRAEADNAALRAGAMKAGRELRELKIELRDALYGEVA